MLTFYSSSLHTSVQVELGGSSPPADIVWVDILRGTPEEIDAVEKSTQLSIPTLASLSEIEHSSRMRREGAAIILSLPLPKAGTKGQTLAPVGFVLTQDLLVTIRFGAEATFDDFAEGFKTGRPADATAPSIMIGLFEVITDTLADRLEEIGDALDLLAGKIFGRDDAGTAGRPSPKLKNVTLREMMREAGFTGQRLGKLRASLLTAGRIVPYIDSEAQAWFKDGTQSRIKTLRADIASLNEYETHLAEKVQFLLDAALGLINMDQNEAFKVLTIASVVGIPPTLVASMYGMNFHNMPELSWAWGYPYGLALIVLSAAIPLIFFKVKGWF
jgi:magnesium transporter